MIRRFAGAIGAALGLLAGLWLMLAPFALGTQPAGIDSDWNDPTITEFTTGAVVAVVGLAGLIAFAMAIREEAVRRGLVAAPEHRAVPAAPAAPAASPQAAPAPAAAAGRPGDEQVADLLAPLVKALADDLGPRTAPNGAHRGGDPR